MFEELAYFGDSGGETGDKFLDGLLHIGVSSAEGTAAAIGGGGLGLRRGNVEPGSGEYRWLCFRGDKRRKLVRERLFGDGFAEVAGATRGEALAFVLGHGMGGEGDDGEGVTAGAEFAGGGVAIEFGHLHVHEDEIKRLGDGEIDGGAAIVGNGDVSAGFSQVLGNQALIVEPVLGEKDAADEGDAFVGEKFTGEGPEHGLIEAVEEGGGVDGSGVNGDDEFGADAGE